MRGGAPDAAAIDRAASRLDADLIAVRRDIHRWPELAGSEARTAALVADRLTAIGLTVRRGVGGHGVVALLDGGEAGPTVAYRAELDAVAGTAASGGAYESRNPGAAHLCGHDLHMAIGLGVAEVLAGFRLPGRVLFVFQPAEESLEGARALIDSGVLDWAPPREIYALHCGLAPVGSFLVQPGYGFPGVDRFRVEVPGPAAGGAALRLAATVNGLSTVRPPRTDLEVAGLLAAVRRADGPYARFVSVRPSVSAGDSTADLHVAVRAWPDDQFAGVRRQVRALAETAGARVVFPAPPLPGMVSSPGLSRDFAASRGRVDTLRAALPFYSDDFALFLRRVPGAMFLLGVSDGPPGRAALPHSPHFAPDERAIGHGVRAMAGFLARRLAT